MIDQIYCMDAVALLKSLPDASINGIITDPPYGLAEYEKTIIKRPDKHGGAYKSVDEEWDKDVPLTWMDEAKRVLTPGSNVIIFNGKIGLIKIGYHGLELGWRLMAELTWFKPDAPPNFSGRIVSQSSEKFYWYCPHGSKWTYNRDYAKAVNGGVNFRDIWEFHAPRGRDRLHPTQKPLLLMDRIVQLFTKPGDVILDPFCGSGTTLVAARNAGRHYIGGDLSQDYCAMAQRWLDLPYTVSLMQRLEKSKIKQDSFLE